MYAAMPAGDWNLYYASRTDRSQAFGGITFVPDVSSPQLDADPEVSSDGCELYFMSARGGSAEIFVATAM